MLCSPSPDVRVAAVEMLREVAALFAALRHSRNESNGRSESPAPSAPSMFSIVESCAGDMVIGALGAEGGTGGIDPCSDPALVAAAASSVAAAGWRGGGGAAHARRRLDRRAGRVGVSSRGGLSGGDHDRARAGVATGPGGHDAGRDGCQE
jgi:hypothetical protein